MVTQSQEPITTVTKLENQIQGVKYTLFCLNIITWIIGAGLFAVSVWLRVDPGLDEWISKLELGSYYIGVYLLMVLSVLVLIVSFLGCAAALTEIYTVILAFIGTQVFGFIFGIIGTAILMNYSTVGSSIQPLIREVMLRLIMESRYEWQQETLSIIQENVGCCGADGPRDYLVHKQPLPAECRDAVTGNAYFHGCVDELTWYMQSKSIWICVVAMILCFLFVINAVLSGILYEALKKEERESVETTHYTTNKRFN